MGRSYVIGRSYWKSGALTPCPLFVSSHPEVSNIHISSSHHELLPSPDKIKTENFVVKNQNKAFFFLT